MTAAASCPAMSAVACSPSLPAPPRGRTQGGQGQESCVCHGRRNTAKTLRKNTAIGCWCCTHQRTQHPTPAQQTQGLVCKGAGDLGGSFLAGERADVEGAAKGRNKQDASCTASAKSRLMSSTTNRRKGCIMVGVEVRHHRADALS